jgi:hypothetical protein
VVTQSLNTWMNGERVGTWLVDRDLPPAIRTSQKEQ